MAYLIDGNNLIGHSSPYPLKDPRSRYHVVSRLLLFHQIKKVRVILAFDGPPDEELEDAVSPVAGFTLRFPGHGQNADAVIKEIISSWENKRQFFLVSTDRELRNYARKQGIKVFTCEEFNKQLKRISKKHKKFLEMQKDNTTPTPLEIKQWQEVFQSEQND